MDVNTLGSGLLGKAALCRPPRQPSEEVCAGRLPRAGLRLSPWPSSSRWGQITE